MNSRELVRQIREHVFEFNRERDLGGSPNVWVEDENGYRQIQEVRHADGGVYVVLRPR